MVSSEKGAEGEEEEAKKALPAKRQKLGSTAVADSGRLARGCLLALRLTRLPP